MALDALLCRSLICGAANTFILLGPLNYGGSATEADEIDLHGRLGIDETLAVVVFVPSTNTVAGTGTLLLCTDSEAGFGSETTQYTFTNVITTTNGRAQPTPNGTGPHLAGYITGPLERYIRFKITASASLGAGAITAALTRDAPLWWRN